MDENDNIELRSERVRKIIGKVPPRLISVGITIVTFFIAGMIWVVTTVHFPFTIECSGGIHYFGIFSKYLLLRKYRSSLQVFVYVS